MTAEVIHPNTIIEIEIDKVSFQLIVHLPGENLPRKFMGIDEMWRMLRERIQDIRYEGHPIDNVEDSDIPESIDVSA